MSDPPTTVTPIADGVARIAWTSDATSHRGAVDAVRRELTHALLTYPRVEALIDPDDAHAQRVATWSGMRREGVMRGVTVDGEPVDRIVYARLATDTPVDEPGGFRALLNSFLPRKRAISQLLIRDRSERVLMCELTYKADWDLPGGVVEVGESPQLAAGREVAEELALDLPVSRLVLTDWLPPWGGWDDAVCLVFDGGVHDAALLDDSRLDQREIRSVQFCTPDEVRANAADFTARRVEAALTALDGASATYTESGRRP